MGERDRQVLTALQEHLQDPSLSFAQPPRRFSAGLFSEVYEFRLAGASGQWTEPLVLRCYPVDGDPREIWIEHALHNGLSDAGFAVPRILVTRATSDERFVVMQRAPGRPRLRGVRPDRFIRDFPALLTSWPATLARIAASLHALGPEPVLDCAAGVGLDAAALSTDRHLAFVERQFDRFPEHAMQDGLEWLRASAPPRPAVQSVVHGDLWPANVLMRGSALSGLVDWNRGAVGDPALDVGFAAAGLALMPAPFPPPPPISSGIHRAGVSMAVRFERAYRELRPVSAETVRYYQALRCAVELAVVVEHGPAGAWHAGRDALTSHFTAMSGVPVSLSPAV